MHEMGLRTESLDPPHNYVPWVVVDGVHNTTIQNMAMADLTALVCQTYQVYIGS
jgi:interferon gamma-inducible protein 30